MRWYQIFDILDCGGMIRRTAWEDGKYIRMVDDLDNDDPLYLINEEQEYIELTEEDLRATDWEEHVPVVPSDDSLSDKEFLHVVRERCRAKLNHQQRALRNRLQLFAERQNAVPNWEIGNDLKYFIVYSFSNQKYRIETTCKEYYPHVVYFSSKETCAVAIRAYKPMLDTTRMLDCQFNLLCTQNYDRKTLKIIDKAINSVKIL